MSADGDDGPGRREVAYRLFAAEFEDADFEYSESDEERAPNYVVTPTGARVNRLFAVGVLTEVESVSDDVLRGRVVDPTGAFVMYAGQYQQDERAFLDRTEPPAFVAVTGKARTFQPDDSDRVFTSVRPESLSEVDADTRDRWTVDAAEQTLSRVRTMATALALDIRGDRLEGALLDRGVEEGLADGIVQAIDHYGTTPTYLAAVRDLAVDAARHVAGELDEVPGLDAAPGEPGDVAVTDLLDEPVDPIEAAPETEKSDASDESVAASGPDAEPATASVGGTADRTSAETADVADGTDEEAEPVETTAETSTDTETEAAGGTEAPDEADTGEADTDVTDTDATDTAATDTDVTDTDPAASTDEGEETEPATDEGPGDFDPEEFELDDEEREEIESEYGTEFQSGTEVDDPGEADIETPDPEDVAESAPAEETDTEGTETTQESEESSDAAPASDADAASEPATEGDEESAPADDVDLVDAVVDVMDDLDDGDGADRDAVVETVADRHGADPDDVQDAVEDALMDGRCYEPEDGLLKPI